MNIDVGFVLNTRTVLTNLSTGGFVCLFVCLFVVVVVVFCFFFFFGGGG